MILITCVFITSLVQPLRYQIQIQISRLKFLFEPKSTNTATTKTESAHQMVRKCVYKHTEHPVAERLSQFPIVVIDSCNDTLNEFL